VCERTACTVRCGGGRKPALSRPSRASAGASRRPSSERMVEPVRQDSAFAEKQESRPARLLVVRSRRAADRHAGARTRAKAGAWRPTTRFPSRVNAPVLKRAHQSCRPGCLLVCGDRPLVAGLVYYRSAARIALDVSPKRSMIRSRCSAWDWVARQLPASKEAPDEQRRQELPRGCLHERLQKSLELADHPPPCRLAIRGPGDEQRALGQRTEEQVGERVDRATTDAAGRHQP
jgi:hypothetical protein